MKNKSFGFIYTLILVLLYLDFLCEIFFVVKYFFMVSSKEIKSWFFI